MWRLGVCATAYCSRWNKGSNPTTSAKRRVFHSAASLEGVSRCFITSATTPRTTSTKTSGCGEIGSFEDGLLLETILATQSRARTPPTTKLNLRHFTQKPHLPGKTPSPGADSLETWGIPSKGCHASSSTQKDAEERGD